MPFHISANLSAKISDLYLPEEVFKWNLTFTIILEGEVLIQYFKFTNILENVSLLDEKDEAKWKFGKKLSVSFVYNFLNFGGVTVKYYKAL